MQKLKKDDKVKVLVGKDKGKDGKVLQVLPKAGKVVVENINMVKKHQKPSPQSQGGIIDMNKPLDISNVILVCPKCKKGTKIKIDVLKDGSKVRKCKKCGEEIK